MKKLIILLNIICTVICVSNPEQLDSRKNSINSLTSKHDGHTKVTQSSELSTQPVASQIKYSIPILGQSAEYDSIVQPQSSTYSSEQTVTTVPEVSTAPILPTSLPPLLPTAPKKNLSYVFTVKPNNRQNFYPSIFNSGSAPVIMQYLPQNQPTGGIQYFQLIPTRSIIVPMSSYLTQSQAQIPQYQFLQQFQQPKSQKDQQNEFKPIINNNSRLVIPSIVSASSSSSSNSSWISATSSPLSPSSSSSLSSSSSSSSSLTPSLLLSSTSLSSSPPAAIPAQPSIPQPSLTNFIKSSSFIPYQNPIGSYSSVSPILSYLKSNSMQIINGPTDLTLNTNEYIPIQAATGDNNSYHMTRA